MAVGDRKDPFPGYNFAVEIEGLVAAGFSEVSGLNLEVEVQEYREGGLNEFVHKRAGPAKYTNLVLKRGLTTSHELWDWHWDVTQGTIQRKNLSVVLMDSAGEERVRWNFEQAYPVKWTGPSLRASGNELAVESLEFAHKGLARPIFSASASLDISVQATVSIAASVSVEASIEI
jgi:phage tail-like protein